MKNGTVSILITAAVFLMALSGPCYICTRANEVNLTAGETKVKETLYLSADQHDIVFIYALSSMGVVEPILGGPMGIALNIGIDAMALRQIFSNIEHNHW